MNELNGLVMRVESEDEVKRQQNEISSVAKKLSELTAGFVGMFLLLAAALALIASRRS